MLENWLCLITNYWPGTETETYSEHCQTFKMESYFGVFAEQINGLVSVW